MVGAFDTNAAILSTFLNVVNMPKDTYELDEIKQPFQC
jgi:hypothetical protein